MSCVAPGCKSGYGSDCKLPPGVTKHIFPKEAAARQAWIEAVPRDDWEPSNSSILCSLHFTDDDFQMERCDTNPHRKSGELKRRRLKKGAVPSVFAVNGRERCLVPSCRRITNTHTFPRYPDQRKKWILTVRNYLIDPKWLPNQFSRICSKHFPEESICKVYRRADKLKPNALPIINQDVFPPNVVREYPKITPMPKVDPSAASDDGLSLTRPMSSIPFHQPTTITVKQEADYDRTFVLDKSPLKRTLPGPKFEPTHQNQHPQQEAFQLQQFQQQQNQGQDPIILMRTKGNPNVLVQVEAQLWTPTGKLPKLPPAPQSATSGNLSDLKTGLGMLTNSPIKSTDVEAKDKTIEKLRAECAKLARRVTHFQDLANDAKTKMDKIMKNLSSLFGEDQTTLLCGGPIKRCTQWSEKTLAKAFDLRLNCGDRAYKYLLEQGYPLPSIKTMQRHIRNVEVKLHHPDVTYIATGEDSDGGETMEIQQQHPDGTMQHHVVPVHHGYLQTQYGQHTQGTQLLEVAHVSGGILSTTHNRPDAMNIDVGGGHHDMNHRQSPPKRLKKQDTEGPTWYSKLSKEVRQKIMFPDQPQPPSNNELISHHAVQGGATVDRIYLAPDLEYAMIPVTDASGHTVVQQVTVQHKDVDMEDGSKEYTTMEVSTGAPIHLHVVDEDNRTIQVLNVDNQGFVTNF